MTTTETTPQATEQCTGRLGAAGETCGAIVVRRDGRLFDVATGRPHGCQTYARARAGR